MTVGALSPYVQGVLTPLAVVGGVGVLWGIVLLANAILPEIVWWTLKKLPLAPDLQRDNSAAIIGSARRAWSLRIPYGARIVVALGITREEHEAYAELIRAGRKQAVTDSSPKLEGQS